MTILFLKTNVVDKNATSNAQVYGMEKEKNEMQNIIFETFVESYSIAQECYE